MKQIVKFAAISLGLIIFMAGVQAEEEKNLPGTGRLAGSTFAGNGNIAFEGSWGGENLHGEEQPPISASVSRNPDKDWDVKVFNNTEDIYTVSLRVVQYDDRSKRLKSTPISTSLKSGENFFREVRAHVSAVHAVVNLVRWTRKEKTMTSAEIKALIEEKKAEIKELEAKLPPVK